MICPICKIRNLKSRVYEHGSSSTMAYYIPYYDELGEKHHHNGNVTSTSYECSNKHVWVTKNKGHCPSESCEWNNKKEIIQVNKDLLLEEELENLKQYLNSINKELF